MRRGSGGSGGEPVVVQVIVVPATLLVRVPPGVPLRWLLLEACQRVSRRDQTEMLPSEWELQSTRGALLDLEDDAHALLAPLEHKVCLCSAVSAVHSSEVAFRLLLPPAHAAGDEPAPAAGADRERRLDLLAASSSALAMGLELLLLSDAERADLDAVVDAWGVEGAAALSVASDTLQVMRDRGLSPPLDPQGRLFLLERDSRGSCSDFRPWLQHQLEVLAACCDEAGAPGPAEGLRELFDRYREASYPELLEQATARARLALADCEPEVPRLAAREALLAACWRGFTAEGTRATALQRSVTRAVLAATSRDATEHAAAFAVAGWAAVGNGGSTAILAALDRDSPFFPGVGPLLAAHNPSWYLRSAVSRGRQHCLRALAAYHSAPDPATHLRRLTEAVVVLDPHVERRGTLLQQWTRAWGAAIAEEGLVELQFEPSPRCQGDIAVALISAACAQYSTCAKRNEEGGLEGLLRWVAKALEAETALLGPLEVRAVPVVARQYLRLALLDVGELLQTLQQTEPRNELILMCEALARVTAAARDCDVPPRMLLRAEEQMMPMLKHWFHVQRSQFSGFLQRCLQTSSNGYRAPPRRPADSAVDLLCVLDGAWQPVRKLFLPDEVYRFACTSFAELMGDTLVRYGECVFHPDSDGDTVMGSLVELSAATGEPQMLRTLDDETATARCRALAGALVVAPGVDRASLLCRLQSLWFAADSTADLASRFAREPKLREARALPYHRPEVELWRRARALAAAIGVRLATDPSDAWAALYDGLETPEDFTTPEVRGRGLRGLLALLGEALRDAEDVLTEEPYTAVAEAAVAEAGRQLVRAALHNDGPRFAGTGHWFAAETLALGRAAEDWGVSEASWRSLLKDSALRVAPLFALPAVSSSDLESLDDESVSRDEVRALLQRMRAHDKEAAALLAAAASSSSSSSRYSVSGPSSSTSSVCVVS